VRERPSRVLKTGDLTTRQDQPSNRLWIAQPAFQSISQMDRAKLVLVGSPAAVITHRDERDLIGRSVASVKVV